MIFDKLIHLPNLIFFPIFNKDQNSYNKFQYQGYHHELNYEENLIFAKKIYNEINKKDLNKIIAKFLNKYPELYAIDIFDELDIILQNKIFKFFNEKNKIKKISDMLGYKVKLRRVSLQINFFNEKTKSDEGPKMYHRDSDSLNDQVKIFMLLNNIDESTGMFYFIPKYLIDEKHKLPFEKNRMNLKISDRWRNYDETVLSAIRLQRPNTNPNSLVKKLKGNIGETLYIDTGKIYHKGGFVDNQKNKRILIQAVYTPILSLSDWNISNKIKILNILKNKLTTLRIKLRKTLKLNS